MRPLGDSQQLQQVFLNVLNNAYDAIQESGNHGKIRIRTRRTQDSIEVAFIDNGTGVQLNPSAFSIHFSQPSRPEKVPDWA